MIHIKNLYGGIIYTSQKGENIQEAVKEAIRMNISLVESDLSNTNLANIKLRHVNLEGANLENANLQNADLRDVNLQDAYLRNANLQNANLRGSILMGAYMKGANLQGVNIYYAILLNADLQGAKNISYIPLMCPSDGAFIGWKKVRCDYNDYLIKLCIPEDAKRSSATSNKCRCSKAEVLEITNLKNGKHVSKVRNYNYGVTTYEVGKIVYPDFFDKDRYNECSNGIHFFINKQDAIINCY